MLNKKVSKSKCRQTYSTFSFLSGLNRWDCKLQLSNSFKSEHSLSKRDTMCDRFYYFSQYLNCLISFNNLTVKYMTDKA